MRISKVEISNFRALQSVEIPLNQFSVLIGENDVGKTSFLYALEKFFARKKLSDKSDWFKGDTSKEIRIVVTFSDVPDVDELEGLKRSDRTIVVSQVFECDEKPQCNAILDDQSAVEIKSSLQKKWFSSDVFHLIPVRRDLNVQFSMNKTALLGKTLRQLMKVRIENGDATESLDSLSDILKGAIKEPQSELQSYLREQMHNDSINLEFADLQVDPLEGVQFDVNLSDERAKDINVANRGAGTQNNLIIALFRLIAKLEVEHKFIFAMEEPENSLHPKAQRRLLSVIQQISQDSQVIVTTHSPVFIDRSNYENNILLRRTINGNTKANTFDFELLEQVRTDIGIRASDALLKGGGNCAILVEGNTEEDGFPVFMEMLGMSEFQLGIAIIKINGSDFETAKRTLQLLNAYSIPSVIVLDQDANQTVDDLKRMEGESLPNLKRIFHLQKGTIEDYYPLEIVAEVINMNLSPQTKITVEMFDSSKHGEARLNEFKKIMHENGAGDSIEYLKSLLGSQGTRIMKERGMGIDDEIAEIFHEVKRIVENPPT